MQFGHFDDARREYVITDPCTPVKWINYIGTLAFGGFIDHTGGVLLCKGDPTQNRITKYIQQMPAGEFKGSTLYLRVRRGGTTRFFCPFHVPALAELDAWECRVGLGYTRWVVSCGGVLVGITAFVPRGDQPVEIRDIRLTNTGDTPCEIDAIPVVEYTHPLAVMQFTNADWVPQTMQSRLVERDGVRFIAQSPVMFRDTRVNFFATAAGFSSYETDRKQFLGRNEYGTWAHPLALDTQELACTQASRGDNVGVLMVRAGAVAPGASYRFATILGQQASEQEAALSVVRFSDLDEVSRAKSGLDEFWDSYTDAQQVQTPDPEFDRMVNIHNPRQCYITRQWSRYLSYYQLGLGSRGIGFRDTSQDLMGVVDRVPDEAREILETLLCMQKADGSASHQFNPMTREGSQGDAQERSDRPQYYGDDHLWVVLATCRFVQETGDRSFLEKEVPFAAVKGSAPASASVLDHLRKALAFTARDCGTHGLPLLGFADWNDTVNLPAGAESLFNANLYGVALREMAGLCRWLGLGDEAGGYERDWTAMADTVNKVAWDGEWYVRYFDHNGAPLGSHTNDHGRIYLNGQSWPVLSGFATPERALLAMDSARRMLNTRYGLKLSTPGFSAYDPEKGGITTYPPGAKENGGIFLHTNPWAVIAETMLGRGDRAFEYYAQVNPAARNNEAETYECEPYVYPQNILGDEHPKFGLARNSWLSGTASWMYQAAVRHILGIRVEYDVLVIDPCVPSGWRSFSVSRTIRGTRYRIDVENPSGVCRGVTKVTVDGAVVEGARVALAPARTERRVSVVMG